MRGICKVIGTTLTKYKDNASQKLVNKLIVDLMKNHPELTIEHFNGVFKALCTKDLANAPPAKSAPAAVITLVWTITIASKTDRSSAEFFKLLEYQTLLYAIAVQSKNEKVVDKAFSFLSEFWGSIPEEVEPIFNKLIGMEPAFNIITFLSAILRYYDEDLNDKSLLEKNRSKLIDHFVRGLITVKVKPNSNHISACQILLNTITQEEFKSQLLPALQRSMLRNPEIILEGVGTIIREIDVDLSEFVGDLGKILIQNLYTKNDASRSESVQSLKEVAKKCSDMKYIDTLLTQIFSVLSGADGKITVAEYRINLLQVS